MRTVMLSVRPEWCELEANEEKTVEVRKTRPKVGTPFKCYLYCTKPRFEHEDFITVGAGTENSRSFYGGGKVIGEFICDRIDEHGRNEADLETLSRDSYVPVEELRHYFGRRARLYGWHISALTIYRRKKELSEFGILRAPQSWCYVKELRV